MNQFSLRKVAPVVILFALSAFVFFGLMIDGPAVSGQTEPAASPTPEPAFDRDAAIAKIRESIKGRESEPAGEVFKNIKNFTRMPAGRLLGVMQMGYSRSLGVDCTHCHTPDDWSSDSKQAKLIARDMQVMAAKINGDLLKNMGSLGGRQAVVNCTTCHRGQVKPATNLD